jgi:hypothetical protein
MMGILLEQTRDFVRSAHAHKVDKKARAILEAALRRRAALA